MDGSVDDFNKYIASNFNGKSWIESKFDVLKNFTKIIKVWKLLKVKIKTAQAMVSWLKSIKKYNWT